MKDVVVPVAVKSRAKSACPSTVICEVPNEVVVVVVADVVAAVTVDTETTVEVTVETCVKVVVEPCAKMVVEPCVRVVVRLEVRVVTNVRLPDVVSNATIETAAAEIMTATNSATTAFVTPDLVLSDTLSTDIS